jgi:hypothetical protein
VRRGRPSLSASVLFRELFLGARRAPPVVGAVELVSAALAVVVVAGLTPVIVGNLLAAALT